jgi:hypothetical protein
MQNFLQELRWWIHKRFCGWCSNPIYIGLFLIEHRCPRGEKLKPFSGRSMLNARIC